MDFYKQRKIEYGNLCDDVDVILHR